MKNEIINPKPNFNIGISILRSILCLWVIIIHCSYVKKAHRKCVLRHFHVPTFFLLSFYFYYPIARSRNIDKVKLRFQRLLYPYIIWPSLIIIMNNFLVTFTSLKLYTEKYSLKDLCIQLLIGARFYNPFWFHFNLIILSIFFTIISFIAKKQLLFILELIGIISLYIHFLGINYLIFIGLKKPTQKSLGSLNEMIPLGVFGCIFNSVNLLPKLINSNKAIILILAPLLYLLFKFDIFLKYPGFLYPNVLLNILASTIMLILFGSINIDKFQNVKKIIKYITSFTGGIYYIHQIFPNYLYFFFKVVKEKTTYFSSFRIYISCYIICFFGSKLFKNTKLKYLFI